ncbi:MAG: hypothetical protein AAFZ65_19985, partial [Planctomycetota bacterium]
MISTLSLLLSLATPQDLQLPARFDLSRGWRVTSLDAEGETLRAERSDLPVEAAAGAERAVLERRISSPVTFAGAKAMLVFEAPEQVERVELDGEVLEPGPGQGLGVPLGSRLDDLKAHQLDVHLSGTADAPLGLWGGVSLELLPEIGLARACERTVGPAFEWTWIDPDTPELVVRTELLSRGPAGVLGVEAKLYNAAGLRVAADIVSGIEVGAG